MFAHVMEDIENRPREARRNKVLKKGLVAFNHDSSTVNCQVRDLSEAGAKLLFEDLPTLPRTFQLHIPVDGVRYPAEVKWIEGTDFGVRFTGPPQPSGVHHDQALSPSFPVIEEEAEPSRSDVRRPAADAAPASLRPAPRRGFGRLK